MKKELEVFHTYLSSQKFKATKTRKLIFQEIFSSKKVHPDAYEIHRSLKKKGRKISLATIYRTLNLLVKIGLVNEVDLGESHSHYEPGLLHSGHGHLVCLSCGRVKEFSHEEIRTILARMGQESKFRMDKFSIQVFGYCENCQK